MASLNSSFGEKLKFWACALALCFILEKYPRYWTPFECILKYLQDSPSVWRHSWWSIMHDSQLCCLYRFYFKLFLRMLGQRELQYLGLDWHWDPGNQPLIRIVCFCSLGVIFAGFFYSFSIWCALCCYLRYIFLLIFVRSQNRSKDQLCLSPVLIFLRNGILGFACCMAFLKLVWPWLPAQRSLSFSKKEYYCK